jgi:hypothetical protein
MVLYTFDAATALHMAHLAKQVSTYIYKTIVKYLEEISPSSLVIGKNTEEVKTPPQDGLDNPRRKKKREIKYEELLREVLDGTRYSVLYPMLLSAYQMTYTEKPKQKSKPGWKKSDVPISQKSIPTYQRTDKNEIFSIFNDPLSVEGESELTKVSSASVVDPNEKNKASQSPEFAPSKECNEEYAVADSTSPEGVAAATNIAVEEERKTKDNAAADTTTSLEGEAAETKGAVDNEVSSPEFGSITEDARKDAQHAQKKKATTKKATTKKNSSIPTTVTKADAQKSKKRNTPTENNRLSKPVLSPSEMSGVPLSKSRKRNRSIAKLVSLASELDKGNKLSKTKKQKLFDEVEAKTFIQSNRKKDHIDDKKLPESISVPNIALQKLFCDTMKLAKGTTFIVKEVIGDGNCLYRSLSQSKIFISMNPRIANDYMAIRNALYEFTGLHPTLSKEIFQEYHSVPKEKLHEEFCKWRATIRDVKIWGGATEMTVFAYCYGIHVVLVSQWYPRVVTTYTYGIKRLKRFRLSHHTYTGFCNQPNSPRDVIFIWHHNISRPTNFMGKINGPTDPKYYNHFSLLECTDRSDIKPEVIFVHEEVDAESLNVNLESEETADDSQEHSEPETGPIVELAPPNCPPTRNLSEKMEEDKAQKPPEAPTKAISEQQNDAQNPPESPSKEKSEQQMESALANPPEALPVQRKCSNESCESESSDEMEDDDSKHPPEAPPLVKIYWEPLMCNHFIWPKEKTYLYFTVEDNVGKGDCFYESILNSSIFQTNNPNYGTDVQKLRTCLKNYAVIKSGFSRAIFEYYNSPEERIDYAIRFLQSLVESKKMYAMTEWVFESLSGNKQFLESIGKKRILAKTVHSTTRKLYEEDDEYCNVLVTFFDKEEINKMSYFQWILDIGTMGQYAGDSEMLLFVHCFNTHIIVVKNTRDGIQIENTGIYVEMVKDPTDTDRVFPTPSINESILLWAVNPKAPSRPLKRGKYLTQHFVTMNLTSEPDPLMEPNILTFERVPWEQDTKKEKEDEKEEDSKQEMKTGYNEKD